MEGRLCLKDSKMSVKRTFSNPTQVLTRDDLVESIHKYFPVTPVPDYLEFCGQWPANEEDEYLVFKDQKWTDLPDVVFVKWYDIDPMIGLPVELREYYLPAFMVRFLTYSDQRMLNIDYWQLPVLFRAPGDKTIVSFSGNQLVCIDRFCDFVKSIKQ